GDWSSDVCSSDLAAGLVWLAAAHPQPLALVLFAVQPGVAVLVVVLGVRWLLHRRYRRRVLFLPGFTATHGAGATAPPASALVRTGNGVRPRDGRARPGEPSTIDAPTSRP